MTSRRRAFRWSSAFVRSSSSTPALPASVLSASGKATWSRSMTNVKMSPCLPQPKQCHVSRLGVTTKDGVFSPWNGQRPLSVVPALRSVTVSPTTSATARRLLISATAPTANGCSSFSLRARAPARSANRRCDGAART